jgi:hypothetical protein
MWRDVFVRVFRGESRPGVIAVFKAVTTGTEREVEAATGGMEGATTRVAGGARRAGKV